MTAIIPRDNGAHTDAAATIEAVLPKPGLGRLLTPTEHTDAAATIEAVLPKPGLGRLLTPTELADYLNVERGWVYEHASELGVIRLGSGPRARLRFDLELRARLLHRQGGGTDPDPCPQAKAAAATAIRYGQKSAPSAYPTPETTTRANDKGRAWLVLTTLTPLHTEAIA